MQTEEPISALTVKLRAAKEKKSVRMALCLAQVALAVTALEWQGMMPGNSFFPYMTAFGLGAVLWHTPASGRRLRVFSALFALMCLLGGQSAMGRFREYHPGLGMLVCYLAVGLAGWYILWRPFLIWLLRIVGTLHLQNEPGRAAAAGGRRVFLLSFGLGVLSWIPYFLCYFPGSVPGDTMIQYQQVMGIVSANNASPWIETLLIQLCFTIGKGLFGTANAGVAVYTAVSVLAGSAVFSYVIWTMYRAGVKRCWRIVLWVLYFVQPFNGLYAITVLKDTIFSYLVLAFVTLLWYKRVCQPHWTRWDRAAFVLLGFGVCAFRGNGPLVYLGCIPVLLIAFRREWKPMAAMLAVTLAAFGLYYGPLFQALNIEGMDTIEALSMPSQQIACVIEDGGDISEEEMALLSRVVDVSRVADTYNPELADPIKHLVRVTGDETQLTQHPAEYIKVYLSIGLKNPALYAQALIMQTRGYWYHHLDYYWRYSTGMADGLDAMNITRQSLLPQAAQTAMEAVLEYYDHVLFQNFWSVGLTTWVVLAALLYTELHHRTRIVFAPSIALLITMFLGVPVFCEFRYVYAIFVMAPALVFWSLVEPRPAEA